ncbi:hypothetical protein MAP00_002149 [Monascus purpureus]|nr:hypothetical protein MAP00_002149 [Monascus purpureus]
MSSRQQIDSVIDDDDEFCPLCIEEFDLSDKNFRPCPCGYQICQFCYNNIKTHSDEGRCPNCRRVYDESTIQYKVPDADEFKADLALKHRKAAAAKKKEAEKREIEASSRKNLAGVRVVQKNLVYVIGLNPTIRDENQLLQTLRGKDYFGQYGEIEKIVVSKAKPGGNPNQGIGVYVTYSRRSDAATCIAAVDGSVNGDRVLRAQFGTTKYCSSFLRNEQCTNRNCTFLHETGEDSDSYSRQDLSSMNTSNNQRHSHPNGASGGPNHGSHSYQPHTRFPAQPISSAMRRQPSKDEAPGRGQADGSALPSSASWANKDAVINRARRVSLSNSQASQSPRPQVATVASGVDESKRNEKHPHIDQTSSRRQTPAPPEVSQPVSKTIKPAPQPENPLLDDLLKAVNSADFRFVFSASGLSTEDITLVENHPSFIDPYGGVKRRAMREKAEQERANREQELLQSAAAEEETRESGSLQLGGEPDDIHPTRSHGSREAIGAIQPPSQQGTATSSAIGSPVSAASHQFQGLNIGARSLTPLQQQQLMLLKSASNQPGLVDPLQAGLNSAAFDQAAQLRQGLLQNQMAQFNALQADNRQSSRFSFVNDSNSKNIAGARMLGQQASLLQAGTPNPLAAPSPQHGLTNTFYTSGVQGPPPGLKTAGTPPVSGGGMFAQGHGFTTNVNLGLGATMGKQDANPDLMRELLRGRSGLQGQENTKLDEDFPPLGTQPKDKRTGDGFGFPLRSRLPIASPASSIRSGTPTLPPGLPLPHGHPPSLSFKDMQDLSSPSLSVSIPVSRSSPAPGTPVQKAQENIIRPPTKEVQNNSNNAPPHNRVKNPVDISLGSPIPKSASKVRSQLNDELRVSTDSQNNSLKSREASAQSKTSTPTQTKPVKSGRSEDVSQSSVASHTKTETTVQNSTGSAPVGGGGSRPNTPMTGISRVSDSSLRQARVLRVVDTPKTETPPPSASQSVSSLLMKKPSRRPSISSLSRPDTPGDFGSEGAPSYTSASVSRANSPPPSRIGSAPVRTMTKSQAKKERRQKAKEAEAKKQEVASTVVEEPVQAPIVGRKRKTKKTPSSSAEPLSAAEDSKSEPGKPTKSGNVASEADGQKREAGKKAKAKDESPKAIKAIPAEDQKHSDQTASTEAWRSNNTVEQMIRDSESNGTPLKDLFIERTSSLQTLLAQLHKSGSINLNEHPLFNPPNLSLRVDLKCTSEDYEFLKRPIELTEEHRKTLLRGEPIRINGDSKMQKNRCLISPHGCVLRHLSSDEEDRYLALEKSTGKAMDLFQDYPVTSITEPDLNNRGGSLDALFATPENFNICWVDETSLNLAASTSPNATLPSADLPASSIAAAPPNVLSAMEADSTRSHHWAIANTAELVNATAASVRSFAAATAKHMLGAAGVVMGVLPDLDDVVGMTDEELRSFSLKSQKDLEVSRKEIELVDKKVSALVKRNKKLVQQALATTVEG